MKTYKWIQLGSMVPLFAATFGCAMGADYADSSEFEAMDQAENPDEVGEVGSAEQAIFSLGTKYGTKELSATYDPAISKLEPNVDVSQYKPDFTIGRIQAAGCSGSAGYPGVSVTVKNQGNLRSRARVDVFFGLRRAPEIGEESAFHQMTPYLDPGQSYSMTVYLDAPYNLTTWIDALVDTTEQVTELDETNNHGEASLTLPDCSLI